MTPALWIGVGFTGVLVIFLMITYFVKDRSSAAQHTTLRFLTALCAGFAGGFFTGGALFRFVNETDDGLSFLLSGTAGFALFFLVWLSYPKRPEQPNTYHITISLPSGLTFKQAAQGIAKAVRKTIVFHGFQDTQLAVAMPATDINAPDAEAALLQLRHQSEDLPQFTVLIKDGVIHVEAK